jgi:dTDP-4-dehydrorhamnose 3,5-epimerase
MKFHESKISGVFEIEPELKTDERGYFARTWCTKEFELHGLSSNLVQCSLSFNVRAGTLRGLHYQAAPHAETKLVRCTKGSIYDVVVDLRPESPTFKSWVGVVLTGANHRMIYIPQGCAHGFLTLEPESEVFYQMSEFYSVESARGVRWDDPAFQVAWPKKIEVIAERDRTYPDFK